MYAILLALALTSHIFSYLTLSPSAPTLNQAECDKKKVVFDVFSQPSGSLRTNLSINTNLDLDSCEHACLLAQHLKEQLLM